MVVSKQVFEDKELVLAGRVRRAFGIRGQLSVDWNNGDSPVTVGSGNVYLVEAKEGSFKKFTIVKDHRHGNYNVITLKELTNRTEAEKYKSSEMWVEEKDLPELEKDEYYTYQLIEMKVETTQGEYLGIIEKIIPTGSNDVYVVKDGKKEILIPAIKDVVKEIDLEKKLVKVELLEGLR